MTGARKLAAVGLALAVAWPLAGRGAAAARGRAQAQAPTPASAAQGAQAPFARKYTGAPITLNLQGADLRTVLRAIADANGLNMLIDPSVKDAAVDVKLTDVPWDQALELILKSNGLWYEIDGGVIRIAPTTVLSQQRQTEPLQSRAFPLNYAKAADVARLLTASRTITQDGTAQVDERTNTVIVNDVPSQLPTVEALIKEIDRPQPQVDIEARFVLTTIDSARELGVQWGLDGQMTPALGNTTNHAFPNSVTVNGQAATTPATQSGSSSSSSSSSTSSSNTAVNLPTANATSALGLALASVNGSFNLDVALSALERSGKGRILSTPHVITQNNKPAEMTQGTQIPYQTVANNTVAVQFKDAALSLRVTPQITNADTVIMDVTLENSTPDFANEVNNVPPIDTQRAVTQVLVANGATTVIGGVVINSQQITHQQTPGLGSIPLLGWLFRHAANSDSRSELLIFITPHVIRSTP